MAADQVEYIRSKMFMDVFFYGMQKTLLLVCKAWCLWLVSSLIDI
jgi:hypothetical protein